jgi:hypothetical protein
LQQTAEFYALDSSVNAYLQALGLPAKAHQSDD